MIPASPVPPISCIFKWIGGEWMAGAPYRRLVLGIGSRDRGDDAVGPVVADRLRGTLPPDVEVGECSGGATELLTRLEGIGAVYLVDACRSDRAGGTIQRLDARAVALPCMTFGVSTHGFSVAEAIELARSLGDLPPLCVVYAVEGVSFAVGVPLSPPVAAAAVEVAERLRLELVTGGDRQGATPCTKPP